MYPTCIAIQSPVSLGSATTLSASTTRVAGQFLAEETSLAGFYFSVGAVSGNPTIRFELWANALSTELPTGAPLTTVDVSGLVVGDNYIACPYNGLTVNDKYWIVAYYLSGSTSVGALPTHLCPFLYKKASTDSGATWAASTLSGATFVIPKFGSGYLAPYFPSSSAGIPETVQVRGTQESGFVFRNVFKSRLQLTAVEIQTMRIGTGGTGRVLAKIYSNNVLATTSGSFLAADLPTGSVNVFYRFRKAVVVNPGDLIRIVLAKDDGTGGDASNYVRIGGGLYSVTNVAELLALKPYGGTLSKTSSLDGGGSWTDVPTTMTWHRIFFENKQVALEPAINRRTSILMR